MRSQKLYPQDVRAGSGMMLASEVSNARSNLRAFGFLPWAPITGAIMRVSAR